MPPKAAPPSPEKPLSFANFRRIVRNMTKTRLTAATQPGPAPAAALGLLRLSLR